MDGRRRPFVARLGEITRTRWNDNFIASKAFYKAH